MNEALRIRLEGGLEVLERTRAALDGLAGLAKKGWEHRASDIAHATEQWAKDAAARNATLTTAARVLEAQALVAGIRRLEAALLGRLELVLGATAVTRAAGLDAKLAVWGTLARHVGLERLPEIEVLASGAGYVRTREWMWAVPASVIVAALGQPALIAVLAALGVAWWEFSKRHMTWRVFKHCVELETEELPVRRIPITEVDSVTQVLGGYKLVALWDESLTGDGSLYELGSTLSDVHAAMRARARPGAPPLWLTARQQKGGLEWQGLVLVCEKGIAWVSEHAYETVWRSAVGGRSHAVASELVAALRSLPALVWEERFDKLDGAVRLDRLHHSRWQSLGTLQRVELGSADALFIDCPNGEDEQLERLREAQQPRRG